MKKQIRDFIAQNKFKILRGQQYVSLIFWLLTFINVIIINFREYIQISLFIYIIISFVGGSILFFIIWLIGYLDVKTFKLFSAEQKYQHELSPVMDETLKNTQEIIRRLNNEYENK